MATFRVKVFFMHDSERAAVVRAEMANIITDTEWTDGYVIAVIDEARVTDLLRAGVVVTPIDKIQRGPARTEVRGAASQGERKADELPRARDLCCRKERHSKDSHSGSRESAVLCRALHRPPD